jgi:hypothetical protein
MQTDRRAILYLVALGRITAAEAERLILACNSSAWNAGRENLWAPAACLAASFLGVACIALCAQFDLLPWSVALAHITHSLLPDTLAAIHRILPLFTHFVGGIL